MSSIDIGDIMIPKYRVPRKELSEFKLPPKTRIYSKGEFLFAVYPFHGDTMYLLITVDRPTTKKAIQKEKEMLDSAKESFQHLALRNFSRTLMEGYEQEVSEYKEKNK